MNHTQQFVGSEQTQGEQSRASACAGMRQCPYSQSQKRCSQCPLNEPDLYGSVGFGGNGGFTAQGSFNGMGGVGIGVQAPSMPAPPSVVAQMPQMTAPPPQVIAPPQVTVQPPSAHVSMGNNFAPAMAELNRQAQTRYLEWAKKGGFYILIIFIGYYSIELASGRWDPFGWWDRSGVETVGAQEPGTNSPPPANTNTSNTTTTTTTNETTTNVSANSGGFELGDGNYMFRLDHDRKIIQLGKVALNTDARVQLVRFRADGYRDVPWPGTSSPSTTTTTSAEVHTVDSRRLLELLRDTRSELETLRSAIEGNLRGRFTTPERETLLRPIRSATQATNEAIGVAGGDD